ncbi:MAG: hypothetical protein LAP85_08390 [Acidobacteriia bacterium]|nr:hypothetical protein [Terriglobia bacterium]
MKGPGAIVVAKPATMFAKRGVPILTAFLLTAALMADDWREKPFDSWNWQDVMKILYKSPWICVSSTSFSAPAVSSRAPAEHDYSPSAYNNYLVPFYSVLRLVTAKPIRDAYLRQVFFQGAQAGWGIDVKNFANDATKNGREALKHFAKSNPNDIMVKGDPEHIVVSITFSPSFLSAPPRISWSGVTVSDPLEGIQQSDFLSVTFLSTRTGKHIALDHYLPPGKDGLGAKFFFPRTTRDGTPSIVKEDKELRFETRIKGKRIQAKFDLAKLSYQSKLEL